jgi:small nuclear ribonucleoprotein (snRNP)-like protein
MTNSQKVLIISLSAHIPNQKVPSMEPSKKPLNVLIKSVGGNVLINLKGHNEYWGKMTRIDGYMNIMLKGAKEYDQNGLVANYGDVFIRGNNIVYICIDSQSPPQTNAKQNKIDDDDDN